ncbi:DMT family transporter [Phenylobacterium sp.]|jgi:drug/metabolite transporter (DMT)-like permease|uniref:DMT family transporter n=1 Tax=Phenylobacterium sp. TaxID=1871053 RepID=UPI002F957565
MTDEPALVRPESRGGLTPNVRGALWMLGSALGFTAMTTLIKFLGDDYPAALQTFYRQAAGFAVLLPVILRQGRAAYATTRPGILFFRSAAGTVAMILSFYAFQKMPLADANALSFTRTLWLVPLAAFVVREKVGPLRIAAAVVGFGGVLLMLRPGAGGDFALGLPALAMLAASFLFALTITGMKVMTRDHSPTVLLVWAMTLGLIFSLPGAFLTWRWPEPVDLVLLCLMGVLGTITQACYIKGMQVGDAAAMAPIDYIRLVFTAAAGFVLFAELPTVWTLAGAAVVVASTLLITWREHQMSKVSPRA